MPVNATQREPGGYRRGVYGWKSTRNDRCSRPRRVPLSGSRQFHLGRNATLSIISPRLTLKTAPSWVIGEWVMGGKYSAEWWEKIAGLNRDLPAQDPVSVVDHLIQATAHGARSPAKNVKRPGQGAAEPKHERSPAD